MRALADENLPRPALEALRKAGWDVFSIAEKCPGISDEEVAALGTEQERILLTFDKDFGELIFRRGLSAGSGVVLFRITPGSPEDAADMRSRSSHQRRIFAGLFASLHETEFASGRWAPVRPA
jgi:predicted nuclease of predicted toxin-antitoxin system